MSTGTSNRFAVGDRVVVRVVDTVDGEDNVVLVTGSVINPGVTPEQVREACGTNYKFSQNWIHLRVDQTVQAVCQEVAAERSYLDWFVSSNSGYVRFKDISADCHIYVPEYGRLPSNQGNDWIHPSGLRIQADVEVVPYASSVAAGVGEGGQGSSNADVADGDTAKTETGRGNEEDDMAGPKTAKQEGKGSDPKLLQRQLSEINRGLDILEKAICEVSPSEWKAYCEEHVIKMPNGLLAGEPITPGFFALGMTAVGKVVTRVSQHWLDDPMFNNFFNSINWALVTMLEKHIQLGRGRTFLGDKAGTKPPQATDDEVAKRETKKKTTYYYRMKQAAGEIVHMVLDGEGPMQDNNGENQNGEVNL